MSSATSSSDGSRTVPRARAVLGRTGQTAEGTGRPFARLARQRRRGRIAVGVALVALAVLANVYLLRAVGHRQMVLQVVRDVAIGQQITRADVALTSVAVEPGVQTILAGRLGEVVGRRAAVDLRHGTLLSAGQVTAQLSPRPGQALVTVAMKSGQLPPGGLAPGSRVRIVSTPGGREGDAQASSSAGGSGRDVAATVDAVGDADTDGTVPVSLLVAEGEAAVVAREGAQGQIALVVTARGV